MSAFKSKPTLVAERDALSVYFEALLREEQENEIPAPPAIAPAPPVVIPAPPIVELTPPPAKVEEPIPAWGVGRFSVVLFRVSGLTLAVPLAELSGVQEWEERKVTAMPGRSDWYLGLTQYRGRSTPVIDTARLVLPPDRLARLTAKPSERLTRVVYIDDGRWGLACDEVADVVALEPGQVRWRSSRTLRRWLAGTVIDKMCALLDPAVFASLLAKGMDEGERLGAGDDKV